MAGGLERELDGAYHGGLWLDGMGIRPGDDRVVYSIVVICLMDLHSTVKLSVVERSTVAFWW